MAPDTGQPVAATLRDTLAVSLPLSGAMLVVSLLLPLYPEPLPAPEPPPGEASRAIGAHRQYRN